MKTIKTITLCCLILTLAALCLFILPTEVDAATSGYYTYSVSDGEATITDVRTSISGEITIPSTLGGYPVTSIWDYAFADCTSLTSVTIPDSVTSIGSYAFYDCYRLTSVTIGNSVTSIGSYAFSDCTSLTGVIIPDSVTSIGSHAFYSCASLTSVTIPDSVTRIGDYAFAYCKSLTGVTIPDSVTSIGSFAFSSCFSLTRVDITDIAAWCAIKFSNTFSNPLYYAHNIYLNGQSVTDLVIPDNVSSIGCHAFYNCTSLTSVTIPDSVTSIEERAFYSCTSLTSVTIPDSVTSIGDDAFEHCSSLTGIWVDVRNEQYSSDSYGVLFNKNKTRLIQAPGGISGAYTIPDSVTSIGNYAFYSCDSLTSVTIGNSVTSIGFHAFYSCDSLTSVTILDSVTSIGGYAFYSCDSLTGVTIPDSVTSIGDDAFYDCTSLIRVDITDIAAWCAISFSNYSSNPLYYANNLYLNGQLVTDLVIPDSVTSIGNSAFSYCTSLTSVTIPDSVTSIGNTAFNNCTNLTSATIGNSVTSIGEYAFSHCTSLTSVTILDSVTSIGEYAFYYCTSLTSVTIGNSVTSIGDDAFSNCTSLTRVDITDIAAWCAISFSNGSSNPFNYAENLYLNGQLVTDLVIPDSVTSIGTYAFCGCDSLTSVSIGNSVTSIGEDAFSVCTSLTSVIIGNSVTRIRKYAFYGCNKLNHILYSGTQTQWGNVSVYSGNSRLTNDTKFHYEMEPIWTKNCVNVGWYCPVCNEFLTKENPEDGSHSYTDIADISCNDCDFIQSVSEISVYQKPDILKYELFTSVLDVTGGIIQVSYNDGAKKKVEMTGDMVSGFDNTKLGTQTLTVTYEGKTTSLTVEIVPGVPNSVKILTMPDTLNYITGAQLNLTGLSLLAYYPGNLTVEIPLADITVSSVDMTTPGIKTVEIGFKGVSTTFLIYVHMKQVVTLDSTTYPESSHNYASSTNESKTFTSPGAGSLILTFNSSSFTESNYDWVYLYDGAGNQVGKYSGSLSGKVVTIPGDTFTIKLTSDSSVNKYGYAFSSIVAETILHDYENGACTICGQFEHGLILTQNTVINENLDHDLYIDLNGYDLSGTIITNGYAVYSMDSVTDGYTCNNMGIFSCVDENGNAIVPVTHFKSDISGQTKRYMTIDTESGYTFHRFYLGITKLSLAPNVTGFGYKAEFYGDEMVQAQIAATGFKLWLKEDRVVSQSKDGFQNKLTLRLRDFDVEGYGETPINANVFLTLTDGTVIESSVASVSMRTMLENINAQYGNFSATQLSAIKAMIEKHAIIKSWNTENLYA